jgi:hypothetical protein
MTTEQNALARKAIQSKHWKWCYGMLALFPAKPKEESGYKVRITDSTDCRDAAMEGALPDLADAATIGCLYALVREEWQDPFLIFRGYPSTDSLPEMWRRLHQGNRIMAGAESHSEAEALVAALEDAASQPDKGATP